MTTLSTSMFKAAPASVVQRLLLHLGRMVAEFRRRRRIRRTAQALRGLSDAALKDIGLHRSEAESVASAAGDRRR